MDEAKTKKQILLAKFIMHSATLCGRVSLLAFVLFLLMGPFDPVTIRLPFMGWLAWDICLSSLFFIQHSGMIRQGLRTRMALFIPSYYHGAIFTLASGLALIIMMLLWQPSHLYLIELKAPIKWLTRGLFFLAAAGMGWGVWALKAFDPFGQGAIKRQLYNKPLPQEPFALKGPYRWVRHPLYFFTLVMIWSGADLTADRLLFNLLWSVWIYLGTVLEEKDLVADFGAPYQHYQKKVPMLIPWKGLAADYTHDP